MASYEVELMEMVPDPAEGVEPSLMASYEVELMEIVFAFQRRKTSLPLMASYEVELMEIRLKAAAFSALPLMASYEVELMEIRMLLLIRA